MAVEFKYIDIGKIGGRGGVVRFWMLAHGIDYKEVLYDYEKEWPAAKAKLVETSENPAGTCPVVKADGKTLTQHVAIMRELAKIKNISSGSYVNDAVADQYQALRDAWVAAAFGTGDKDKLKEHAKAELGVFEAMYNYAGDGVYLEGDSPLWGDSALFGMVRDLMLFDFVTEDDLPPRVKAMIDAYKSIPAVAGWLQSKE